jgi:hypothetical protein
VIVKPPVDTLCISRVNGEIRDRVKERVYACIARSRNLYLDINYILHLWIQGSHILTFLEPTQKHNITTPYNPCRCSDALSEAITPSINTPTSLSERFSSLFFDQLHENGSDQLLKSTWKLCGSTCRD